MNSLEIFTPKKLAQVVAGLVVFCVALGTVYYFFINKDIPGDTGQFSDLLVNQAYAHDNFELEPTSADSLGIEPTTSFALKSKIAVKAGVVQKHLSFKPKIPFSLQEVSNTDWLITPDEPLSPETIVNITLNSTYTDEDGIEKEKEYAWAFQVKDSFKVIHSIPRQAATNVPLNTGIEFVFSHENFTDYKTFFDIQPEVAGRFEKHGRTLVFVPIDPLKDRHLYTATIKKGLPLQGSLDTLQDDYSITFETVSKSQYNSYDTWFRVYTRDIEVSSKDVAQIQVQARNATFNNKVEVSVYSFSSLEVYVDALKDRDKLPWWSRSKDEYLFHTDVLKKVDDFELPIQQKNHTGFITLPHTYEKGFYLISSTALGTTHQTLMQVSDLAAYINVTKTDTVVWVNNLITDQPVRSASLFIHGTGETYQTDTRGIAMFKTPEIFLQEDTRNSTRYYFEIQSNTDVLILPAVETVSYYYWGANVEDDDYWVYVYTDRPQYQTTDTIKFWGVFKKRDGKPLDENVTLSLYKEGYVDYYYRPVRIQEQEVTVDNANSFSGEFQLKNVRPDYYALELTVGDALVNRKYVHIKPYDKPAYNLEIIPQRRYAFAGDEVQIDVKSSFFEGTPVPDLDVVITYPNNVTKNGTTDENGMYTFRYTKEYSNDLNWPKYEYFSVKPAQAEQAEISDGMSVIFYGPKVHLQTKVDYPDKGAAEVLFTTKYIDFDTISSDVWWVSGLGDTPAPGVAITASIIKVTYDKREIGTYYDFINKRTYKQYQYNQIEETVGSIDAVTNAQGEYTHRQTVEPDTSYKIVGRYIDAEGRSDELFAYLYYYNGRETKHYSQYNSSYYRLVLEEENTEYDIGEPVEVRFMRNDELLPDGDQDYLFLQLQNGLQELFFGGSPVYQFVFDEADIPNVNLVGIYYNGEGYAVAQTGYYSGGVVFNKKSRGLNIEIDTDKQSYMPGEDVELSLLVTDQQGKGMSAAVNLNLVDEAYYAVVQDSASPAEALYSFVGTGSLKTVRSHVVPGAAFDAAEKGGCFGEETQVLLADTTTKAIKDIKIGDKVATFENPASKKLVEGTVTYVFVHTVDEYLVVNDNLVITPEHIIFVNNGFSQARDLKKGDILLNKEGMPEYVNSIELITHDPIVVYNLQVDPQHTYIAGGVYVHNDKGGTRENFVDAALFTTVATNDKGDGSITFHLPDNITSWRVTAQGVTADMYIGTNTAQIPVTLPVFAEVTVGKEYLVVDEPVARLRAFGTALNRSDAATFTISAETLGLEKSSPLEGKAFQPVYFHLPPLELGTHDIIYTLKTEKGNDAIKLPIQVVRSRLSAETAENIELDVNTALALEGDEPVRIVLQDQGQNQLYAPLLHLQYAPGDRVDQKLSRVLGVQLLNTYYERDIPGPLFESFMYQMITGGITLLPYSSEELELSARVALTAAELFDKTSLAQYFYKVIDDKNSNREDMSLALLGLSSLGDPVLTKLQAWQRRDDLTVIEQLYLAESFAKMGDTNTARDIYLQVVATYGRDKLPHKIIQFVETQDDVFKATILAAVVAQEVNAPDAHGLFDYVQKNQILYGTQKNSEMLYNLEKIYYISQALPKLAPSPAQVTYELQGKKYKIDITGRSGHAFQIMPKEAETLKFLEITGDVGLSVVRYEPIDISNVIPDADISISREYYVQGRQTTSFQEGDLVQVRLHARIGPQALTGSYRLTDILPSGLMPVTKLQRSGSYDCKYWYPYNTEGQKVNYHLYSNWMSTYCGSYLYYYAQVRGKGVYKAEPALLQSYMNPEYVNYSQSAMITIE